MRFEGFSGDWEEKKLKELAKFNPKAVLPSEFEYVDLESVVGIEMISHRLETKESAPSRAQRLAKKGDVFYQTVRPYQKNNYLFDLPHDNFVFSTGYAQLRPDADSYFLLSQLQEEKFVNKVMDRSTGTSYPAINSNDLSDIEVKIPSNDEEQTRIGSFFKQLDDAITIEQQQLDALKQSKQGFLQKMFPKEGATVPEVRFEGFSGDWEEKKLDELGKVTTGKAFSSKEFDKNGAYLVITNKDISSSARSQNTVTDKINCSDIEVINKYNLSGRNLLVTMDGVNLGKTAMYSNDKALLAQRVGRIQSKNLDFIFQVTNSSDFLSTMRKLSVGNAIKHISLKQISDYTVYAPKDLEEQTRIGSFFKQLDDAIMLQQRELDALKETKKAFLQKLFV